MSLITCGDHAACCRTFHGGSWTKMSCLCPRQPGLKHILIGRHGCRRDQQKRRVVPLTRTTVVVAVACAGNQQQQQIRHQYHDPNIGNVWRSLDGILDTPHSCLTSAFSFYPNIGNQQLSYSTTPVPSRRLQTLLRYHNIA